MIALALLIAALVVCVLGLFGAYTVGKMILLALALIVGAYIAERVESYRTRTPVIRR